MFVPNPAQGYGVLVVAQAGSHRREEVDRTAAATCLSAANGRARGRRLWMFDPTRSAAAKAFPERFGFARDLEQEQRRGNQSLPRLAIMVVLWVRLFLAPDE